MDDKLLNSKSDKKPETFIINTFIMHHIFMFLGALYLQWDVWAPIVIIGTGAATLVVSVGKYWNFNVRAMFCSTMICVSLVIYGTQSLEPNAVLAPCFAVIVLMGWYAIENLMILPFISISFLFFYHIFITQSVSFSGVENIYNYLIPIINVYFVIGIIFFWTKFRNQSAQRTVRVIESLKIAERGKDDFLANVSHEIRTPINTINGMSAVILREDELNDKVREEVLDIQMSGRQLISVVSDILDFSELQTGKQEITEVSYNISSTINDVMNIANAMKKEKNIEFVVECDADMPSILIGDEQRIRRVILNLINNAIKFTNDGCVVLKISHRKENYGVNMSVTVKDTGIGIEKTHLEKLFTSYNQVDTKRNRQEGGIGLGLAISKAIVEKMGGFITVNSEVGKGSEFKFVIPQKVENEEPIVDLSDLKSLNVLVYINLEQFHMVQIRDAYSSMIINIAEQLGVSYHFCHNLAELKRRAEHNYTSHVFISFIEYMQDPEYFNKLSDACGVIVAIDEYQERYIKSDNIHRLYKPFYVLPVVNILNGKDARVTSHSKKFIAPEARILVVDDNLINLKVISSLLKPYQMKIVTANSGAEALDKIEEKNFDIVFMDHMMPEMDGVETLKRIRNKSNLYFKEVPIIALTANAVAGAREMFLNEGFQEFISKPIELSVMDRELRNYLPDDKIVYVSEMDEAVVEPESQITNQVVSDTDTQEKNQEPLGDIDVKSGITFCGTKEDFIDVLKIHCTNGVKNKADIQGYYEAQDWKNYTILVHGLKSSMKSIGANELSDMAKQLESAGKLLEIDYILSNHDAMMAEYDRILNILYNYFGLKPEEPEIVDVSDYEEIDEASLIAIIDGMESAMYEWDGDKMLSLANELQGKKYNEKPLDEIFEVVKKKIDMSDYMSACETLKNWKDKI